MRRSFEIERPKGLARMLQRRGYFPHRNLYWSWYEPRNFGDWVGPYLYEAITGRVPWFASLNSQRINQSYCFAGSILNRIRLPDRAIVWGSGIIAREDEVARPRQLLCVRGPLSRERMLQLGYECPERYGDPAVLLSEYFFPEVKKDANTIGLIPHFVEHYFISGHHSSDGRFRIIDVGEDVESVVRAILSCAVTASSSLHGIIVSHAYGVPCVWVASEHALDGDGVKFLDYFASVGIPNPEPSSWSEISILSVPQLKAIATLPSLERVRQDLRETCPI